MLIDFFNEKIRDCHGSSLGGFLFQSPPNLEIIYNEGGRCWGDKHLSRLYYINHLLFSSLSNA